MRQKTPLVRLKGIIYIHWQSQQFLMWHSRRTSKKTHPGETFHTQTHPWWRCRESPATNLQEILRHLYVQRVQHANPWGKLLHAIFCTQSFWQRFLRKNKMMLSYPVCSNNRSLVVNAFFVHVHNKVTTPTQTPTPFFWTKSRIQTWGQPQNHLLEIISRQPQNWEDGESSQSHVEKSVKL